MNEEKLEKARLDLESARLKLDRKELEMNARLSCLDAARQSDCSVEDILMNAKKLWDFVNGE